MSNGGVLPPGLVAYRETPVFDEATIPAGLRHEHRTKPGVWAVIIVLEGRLLYRTGDPPVQIVLSPDRSGTAAPEQSHEVEPDGPVRFYIEFYRAAAT